VGRAAFFYAAREKEWSKKVSAAKEKSSFGKYKNL